MFPAVFSNIPKLDGKLEPDLDLYAWDAAMRTSAAPTYFPSHKGYVDGAMFANNPSMLAVSKACAHFPKVTPENTVVLLLASLSLFLSRSLARARALSLVSSHSLSLSLSLSR